MSSVAQYAACACPPGVRTVEIWVQKESHNVEAEMPPGGRSLLSKVCVKIFHQLCRKGSDALTLLAS